LPWRALAGRFEKPLTGLLLTVGLAVGSTPYLPSQSAEALASGKPTATPAQATNPRSFADGVYLYGQSEQPEQIGSQYMVFQVDHGQIVGAFYMPYSSFDCFYGKIESDKMALTIVNSYEQTRYPYAVALQPTDSVAMAGSETLAPMGLEGFHAIANVSSNDQRILSTCKANHQ
jgi:hypothetical protein